MGSYRHIIPLVENQNQNVMETGIMWGSIGLIVKILHDLSAVQSSPPPNIKPPLPHPP